MLALQGERPSCGIKPPPPSRRLLRQRSCLRRLDGAREEAEQRKHQYDDQDDPENAQRVPSSRLRTNTTKKSYSWLRVYSKRQRRLY
jgi:hypothetical protein